VDPSSDQQPSQQQQHPMAQQLVNEIAGNYQKLAERVVDWWLKRMPEAYFREIDPETRMSHLRALISQQAAGGQRQAISLTNKVCLILKID
jgi:hypothetical protein